MNTKVDEGKLISGKEAKLAWANGCDIQVSYRRSVEENTWFPIGSGDKLNIFDRDDLNFRIKPRTITINGIEVPAPFEPKEGETYWFITDSECGYNWVENKQGCRVGIAAWRTEDEIKQVVAALCQVFGGSYDN